MKRKIMHLRNQSILAVTALALLINVRALGQGTFQNLNFEAAQLVPIPSDPFNSVEFGSAFPGWTGYINGQVQATTRPNGIPLGQPGQTPFIAILAPPGWSSWQGSYSVGFAAATSSGSFIPVALVQTGLVPSQAQSLQFLAVYAPAVYLGGQLLPSVSLGTGPSISTLFGVDVSGFAGQTLELRFQPNLGIDYMDAIQFSNQPIPEPSVFGLLGLGALLLGRRFVRARR